MVTSELLQCTAAGTFEADQSELGAFRCAHPEVRFVDILLSDLAGTPRGKRVRINELDAVYDGGFFLPGSMFAMDALGRTVEATGLGFDDGDGDRCCTPVARSLLPVPWNSPHVAQVQVSMQDHDGTPFFGDPRHILSGVVRRFRELGLRPVIAIELEFYLLDLQRAPDGRIQPPLLPVSRRREFRTQNNAMATLDEFSAVLADIANACDVQHVPASTSLAECGPGQYEVNLRHVDDACLACDHAFRLKRIVHSVAARHGMLATFMPKPYSDAAGSGAHIHVSIIDREGRPVFAADDVSGSPALKHAIGGLAATMAECMLMFAPTANSYRRYRPESFVPLNPSWGVNNRGVSLRVPVSSPENRRIEHRVAGADVNPYLLAATVLAGIHYGMHQRIDPGPPLAGNAYRDRQITLPTNWPEALLAFERSAFVREYLGERFHRLFATTRRGELHAFEGLVTQVEYDWYLTPG